MDLIHRIFFCCFKKKKAPALDDEAKENPLLGDPECLATFGAGCYWGTEKYFAVNF